VKPSALVFVVALGAGLVSLPARADPACIAAYEAAQTLRKDGKPLAAKAEAAVCARAECPALLTRDCSGWLVELEGAIPSVILDARTASGAPHAAARVSIDGARKEPLDRQPRSLEPGAHRFVFEADGVAPVERTVVVKEGEKQKKISVTFGQEHDARPVPLGVWLFGGASVLALGIAAGFAADGFAKKSALGECKPRCTTSDVYAMTTSLGVAGIGLGAGVAAGAAALYLFVTRPASGAEGSQASPPRAVPFAGPLPGGGTFGLTARF
jgi:hypothetical protein